jgi:hypothetical protein
METMNLNDTEDGMVPLYQQPPTPKPAPPKVPEKNIPKQQTKMDSTPIADIMQDAPGMGMMDAQDPRAQFMNTSNYMPQPPMMAPGSSPQAKPKKESGNPLNLTDEQMSALVAGVCAIIAFSGPIQDKLSTTVPQFLSEAGSRSTTGLIVSGLLAAIIFFFAQRFLNK